MKRGLEGGEAAPAPKRVKRDEDAAASSGPVASAAHLMSVDKIEQYTEFHKELRLKQLNREYLKALEQAEMWEARQCDFLGGLRVIEAAWSQLIEDMRVLLARSYWGDGKLEQHVETALEKIKEALEENEDDDEERVSTKPFLAQLVEHGSTVVKKKRKSRAEEACEDTDPVSKLAEELSKKKKLSETILKELLFIIDKQRSEGKLSSDANTEQKLEVARCEGDMLQMKLRRKTKEVKELENKIAELEDAVSSLVEERDAYEEKVIQLERKVDRERAAMALEQPVKMELEKANDTAAAPSKESQSASTGSDGPADSQELEEARLELKIAKDQAALRMNEIAALQQQISSANESVRSAKQEALSVHDRGSEVQLLKSQLQHYQSEHQRLSEELSGVREDAAKRVGELERALAQLQGAMETEAKEFASRWDNQTCQTSVLQMERNSLATALKKTNSDTPVDSVRMSELEKLTESQAEELRRSSKRFAKLRAAYDKLDKAKAHEVKQLLEESARSSEEQIEALAVELGEVAEAYEAMQEQNTRLMAQLREKEASNASLVAEQIRQDGEIKLLRAQSEAVSVQTSTLEEHAKSQKNLLNATQQELSALRGQLSAALEELSIANKLIEGHKQEARMAHIRMEETRVNMEKVGEPVERFKRQWADAESRIEELEAQLRRKTERVKLLQKQLGHYKARGDDTLKDEILDLQKKLKCSICKEREKDAVIKRCMHIFCEQCIQNSLDSRGRKCPTCKERFGKADVHHLWFG